MPIIVFWSVFVLSYGFASNLLSRATFGLFRLGGAVVGLGLLALLLSGTIVISRGLLGSLCLMSFTVALSGFVNRSSLLLMGSFLRIPLTVYVVYSIVAGYLRTGDRTAKTLRVMYLLATLQLPVIALQRFAYPWLPYWLKAGTYQEFTELMDIGVGSFTSDADASFYLVSLLILLLFSRHVQAIVRRKWLMAGWLTITVFFLNSQVHYLIAAAVWGAYCIKHIRFENLLILTAASALSICLLVPLFQAGLMPANPLEYTSQRLSRYSGLLDNAISTDRFLAGQHDRAAGIYYYMQMPVKWLGDGPGSCYNTITRERSFGCWGQILTYYPEVGLLGLSASILVFWAIAQPIRIGPHVLKLDVVQALMFFAVNVLSWSKYPMNSSSMLFTFSIALISYRVLHARVYR